MRLWRASRFAATQQNRGFFGVESIGPQENKFFKSQHFFIILGQFRGKNVVLHFSQKRKINHKKSTIFFLQKCTLSRCLYCQFCMNTLTMQFCLKRSSILFHTCSVLHRKNIWELNIENF